jgi:hypothetical protein
MGYLDGDRYRLRVGGAEKQFIDKRNESPVRPCGHGLRIARSVVLLARHATALAERPAYDRHQVTG